MSTHEYDQPGPTRLPSYRDLVAGDLPEVDPVDTLHIEGEVSRLADAEYIRRVARERAAHILREEAALATFVEPPLYRNFEDMQSFLATEPDEPLIIGGGLLGEGDLCTITGQAKGGKTTLVRNLIIALTEARPFLGHAPFSVERPYRTSVWDGEMAPAMWVRRMRKLNPQAPRLIQCLAFRGYRVDLSTDLGVQYAIARHRDFGTEVWIIDNYSTFSSSVESNNDDVEINRFHENLKRVQSACPDMLAIILIHHAGHQGGRARGSSVFRDRPDVLWDMTKIDPPVFRIAGRYQPTFDVRTAWDEETDILTYLEPEGDTGNPTSPRARSFRERILEKVLAEPGIRRTKIIQRISSKYWKELSAEIESMVSEGVLRLEHGATGAMLVYPGPLQDVHSEEDTSAHPDQ